MVPGFFTDLWPGVRDNGVGSDVLILIGLLYLVEYLAVIFFDAARTSAAIIRLGGGGALASDPSPRA